ncbi:MAG: restriction endonuclease subunit S [Nostocales cyanobacterium]|nr:MAG: restriction endonuclease subunit S [Nostocales cyanobacterium]
MSEWKETDLVNLKVPLPHLEEQKRIMAFLSCLDAKIDNLRRQNETLEKIAQTLFKHWFIDFEFPNEEGKPYKSSGGAMSPSELGDIPAGWKVGKLGEIINIKHGFAFKGECIVKEETSQILLTPGNFKIGGGFNDNKYKYYSNDDYAKEYILNKKDLIVTMTDLSKEGDTLGYPAIVPEIKGKILLHNQRLGKIETNSINKPFLYHLMCTREYRSYVLGTSSGSTVRHTSPSRICDYQFVMPSPIVINNFSKIAETIIDKQLANFSYIQTLIKTRDVLLPKLMTGEIRIQDKNTLIEKV